MRSVLVAGALVASTFVMGCEPDPEPPPTTTPGATPDSIRPGDHVFPPGTVIPPGSELERRLNGDCIPFNPWDDGRDDPVCVMTTPQNGTLGRLGDESDLGTATEDEVGGSSSALRDSPPSPLPGRVDHRSQYLDGCITVSNQHACGWCTVHATTAMLEALHCSKGCDVPELSEAHLRSNSLDGAAFGSCSEGWNTQTALQTLVDDPIVDNATWPYIPNGRGLNNNRPSDSVLGGAPHQPTGWHAVDLTNLQAIKEELASEREIIISVPVYRDNGPGTRTDWQSGTANVQAAGTTNRCRCGDTTCTDAMCIRGYHAIVLTGYDDATMQFTFLNSWGKDWGSSGYGTMDYAFVTGQAYSGGALDDVNTDIMGNACEDDDLDAAMDSGTTTPMDGGTDGGADGGTPPAPRSCGAASDCATCTALSGCGWCDGGGCEPISATMCSGTFRTATCDPTTDPCRSNSACGDCVGAAGCVWCAGTSTCFDPSLRTIECNDPRNAADQCNDCGAGATCGDCLALDGCGWCPGSSVGVVSPGTTTGSCVSGSRTSADRASCPAFRGISCNTDECSLITNCADCTDNGNCGWCDGTDQCMLGGFFGPVDDETFGSTCGEDWDWFGIACDNTDGACGEAISCRECLRSVNSCEWDDTNSMCNGPMMSLGGMVFTDDTDCPPPCGGPFAQCSDASECCAGLECVNNDCVDCAGAANVGASCDPTVMNACCGTLVCSQSAGGGGTTCCKSDTDSCSDSSECCGDMQCVGGRCACQASGQSCQSGRECCGASFCDMGTCT